MHIWTTPSSPRRRRPAAALSSSSGLVAAAIVLAALAGTGGQAVAQAVWNGSASDNWFDGGNWSTSAPPTMSDVARIDTFVPGPPPVLRPVPVVRQADAVAGNLEVGVQSFGALTVEGGGTLSVGTSGGVTTIGRTFGGTEDAEGTVIVTGAGSTLRSSIVSVGRSNRGNSSLIIQDGGTVLSDVGLSIGRPGSASAGPYLGSGSMTVTGAGSNWTGRDLSVGNGGSGILTITDQGAASGMNLDIGSFLGTARGTGTVTVSDRGILSGQTLVVGQDGSGTLTVSDRGSVVIDGGAGPISIATRTDSTGVLNIGAGEGSAAAAAGLIQASRVEFGSFVSGLFEVPDGPQAGAGTLVLNHTGLAESGEPLDFASQFRSFVDTNGGTIRHLAGETIFSGVNTAAASFTGTLTVRGGRLRVNGVFGDLDPAGGLNQVVVNVGSDGTLGENGIIGGSGTIAGSLNLLSGGVVAPGNSIGTLNVAGNVAFEPGARYDVEIEAAGASDRLSVGGTADLGGASVLVTALDPATSYVNGQTYLILDASGGLNGTTFSGASFAGGSAFLAPSLLYGPNTVTLLLGTAAQPGPTPPLFQRVAETDNQFATAGALNTLAQSGENLALFNAVLSSDAPNARLAFDRLSGEVHASLGGALAETSAAARAALASRLDAALGGLAQGADLVPAEGHHVSSGLWLDGFGTFGRADGNGNAARAERDTGGVFVGGDHAVGENSLFGLFAGYSRLDLDISARSASADVDSYHLGLYGAAMLGGFDLSAGAAYTHHEIDTERTVAFPGFTDRLSADYDAGTAQVFGEIGYRATLGGVAIKPFAGLAYVHVDADGFTERGGAARLASSGVSSDTLFTTLGVRASADVAFAGRLVELRGMAGWRNASGDTTPSVTNAFVTGAPFTVQGAPLSRNSVLLEAGFATEIAPSVSLSADYVGQFGEDSTGNGFKIGLSSKF